MIMYDEWKRIREEAVIDYMKEISQNITIK
jgi:hypothetical protein